MGEKSIRSEARGEATPGWNELGFVPVQSFRRMAPSILNLEVSRLGDLIAGTADMEFRNALVKSRYELQAFVDDLAAAAAGTTDLDPRHLRAAIVNLPLGYPEVSSAEEETLAYILDRLEYVHNRIRFVYK